MSQARPLDARPWPSARRRAPRRSRLIDVLRILLPALALALIVLVVAWPQIMRAPGGIAVPIFAGGGVDQADRLRMDSPRYVGQTKRNRPYEVTAESASLDPLETNIVHLDRPAADIALGTDGNVHVVAQSGTYHRDTENLLLDGGIEVVTSTGYRFATSSARVNLAEEQVRGWRPIEGTGPAGQLSADRFEIRDAGAILHFEGRVKVTVLPPPKREAQAREAATARPEGGPAS